MTSDLQCAFCPHPRSAHRDREDIGMMWCNPCGDPCSYLFMPVHEFEPSSPNRRGPHGTKRLTDCRRCGLGREGEAHLEDDEAAERRFTQPINPDPVTALAKHMPPLP